MSPQQLLNFFIEIAPEFADEWNYKQNYSIWDDGTFTLHGVCSQFSYYFTSQESFKEPSLVERTGHPDIPLPNLKRLFNFIEENICIHEVDNDLDNALCTCFLEDITKLKAGDYARQFMGEKFQRYYDLWNI
jgi:hypothetical protein